MRCFTSLASTLTGLSALLSTASSTIIASHSATERSIEYVIKPKIWIISMFSYEEEAWQGISEFNIYERNITVPGFSPLYPEAHCTENGDICQLTTGESGEYM